VLVPADVLREEIPERPTGLLSVERADLEMSQGHGGHFVRPLLLEVKARRVVAAGDNSSGQRVTLSTTFSVPLVAEELELRTPRVDMLVGLDVLTQRVTGDEAVAPRTLLLKRTGVAV
jgi:hypothetical protein